MPGLQDLGDPKWLLVDRGGKGVWEQMKLGLYYIQRIPFILNGLKTLWLDSICHRVGRMEEREERGQGSPESCELHRSHATPETLDTDSVCPRACREGR